MNRNPGRATGTNFPYTGTCSHMSSGLPPGRLAEYAGECTDPVFREALEQDPSLEPAVAAEELQLRELGAPLEDPEPW